VPDKAGLPRKATAERITPEMCDPRCACLLYEGYGRLVMPWRSHGSLGEQERVGSGFNIGRYLTTKEMWLNAITLISKLCMLSL